MPFLYPAGRPQAIQQDYSPLINMAKPDLSSLTNLANIQALGGVKEQNSSEDMPVIPGINIAKNESVKEVQDRAAQEEAKKAEPHLKNTNETIQENTNQFEENLKNFMKNTQGDTSYSIDKEKVREALDIPEYAALQNAAEEAKNRRMLLSQNRQVDLTPLMALADLNAGTNFAQTYKAPPSNSREIAETYDTEANMRIKQAQMATDVMKSLRDKTYAGTENSMAEAMLNKLLGVNKTRNENMVETGSKMGSKSFSDIFGKATQRYVPLLNTATKDMGIASELLAARDVFKAYKENSTIAQNPGITGNILFSIAKAAQPTGVLTDQDYDRADPSVKTILGKLRDKTLTATNINQQLSKESVASIKAALEYLISKARDKHSQELEDVAATIADTNPALDRGDVRKSIFALTGFSSFSKKAEEAAAEHKKSISPKEKNTGTDKKALSLSERISALKAKGGK